MDHFDLNIFDCKNKMMFQKILSSEIPMHHKISLLCAQAYAHAQRTPLFWMVHSNQVIDFTITFVLQETGELAV